MRPRRLKTTDDRQDRTRRFFGGRGLARIQRSRVLVIGVGAVGNEVAKNLALVGVRRLTLVDADTVELSNLNRCIFFRESDVGRKKVHVARRALRAAAPAIEIVAVPRPIQEAPEEVWHADVVALCVDDELARYYVNARLLGERKPIPVVNGAMGRTWAETTILVPGQTACLVCLWSEEYLRGILSDDVRRRCDAFFQAARVKFPAISVLTSLVGAVSSTEVVKLLAHSPEELPPATGKRLRYDVRRHEMVVQTIVPNPQCVDAMCRKRRAASRVPRAKREGEER
jgi:molybdopterin/thiamine biosynthesis adenylyltransferase